MSLSIKPNSLGNGATIEYNGVPCLSVMADGTILPNMTYATQAENVAGTIESKPVDPLVVMAVNHTSLRCSHD